MSQQLDRLPDDILVLIISCLDIPDILSVRRTSRYLYAVTYTQSVWKAALDRLSDHLPLPSFTKHDVTSFLAQELLEQTAISALRLERNWNTPEPVPLLCMLIKGARHIDKLQFLDDGRWLLSLTDGEKLALYRVTRTTAAQQQGYPIIFQPAYQAAEFRRSSGRGWHCGFECTLEGGRLMILVNWRNQTDLLHVELPRDRLPGIPHIQDKRVKFEYITGFERIRESALTPCDIDHCLLVYPAQSGQLRVVNYKSFEEGALSTWHPSPSTAVAEGWSREDIIAVKLVSPYVLVVKPTSFQFFPIPELEVASSTRLRKDMSSSSGAVFHLPFRIDSAVFSDSSSPVSSKTIIPLSILVRDVDNWCIVHYQLKSSRIDGPLYSFPPDLVSEISFLAYTPRDRHNTFTIGRTGARGIVQGANSLLGYTTPQLALRGTTVNNVAGNTPLRVLEGANGMSIDEATGKIACGEADGDIWVFGFGFDWL